MQLHQVPARERAHLGDPVMLPYVVGIVLSIGVALFARWVGFDRDRAFYPAVLIVIASSAWCLAYDVGAGGALAWLLTRADADAVGATE
jgi:hypothetical protein